MTVAEAITNRGAPSAPELISLLDETAKAATGLRDRAIAAVAAKGFSGAEIDAAVQGALYASFAKKQDLTTTAVLDALKTTVPHSTTRAEEIETLRDWARTRAVPASASAQAESA